MIMVVGGGDRDNHTKQTGVFAEAYAFQPLYVPYRGSQRSSYGIHLEKPD